MRQRFPTIALPASLCLLALLGCQPKADHSAASESGGLVKIEGLGAISFPNSGSPDAQDAFYRGVLLLHSFEFRPAAEAFQEAQAIDPDFALAYWGEAMTYNHPLWRSIDCEKGNDALSKLAPTPEERRLKAPTEREKRYLDAVEILYSCETFAQRANEQEMCGANFASKPQADLKKFLRDSAYMQAMRELHESYPDDDEASAFYALSVLGTQNGARDFTTYMKGASLALPIFERNPLHPGAAHYTIHSFDDPVHASLGLPAANAYSEIAPNAAHAQHMTSHIFLALGLWDRNISANVRACEIETANRAKEGKGPNICGHYSSWLHYGYLMTGQREEAEAIMQQALELAQGDLSDGEWSYYVSMRARHVLDLEDWDNAKSWDLPSGKLIHSNENWGYGNPYFRYRLTDAFIGLRQGDPTAARSLVADGRPEDPKQSLQIDQVAGLLAIRNGDAEKGLDLLRKAAATEETLPLEFGPPEMVQPTYETLGQALLDLGYTQEAQAAFQRAIERTPRRAPAVAGLEKAQSANTFSQR